MSNLLTALSLGGEYRYVDSEEEFAVIRIYPEHGYAVIESDDGDELTMPLIEIMEAIRHGRIVLSENVTE